MSSYLIEFTDIFIFTKLKVCLQLCWLPQTHVQGVTQLIMSACLSENTKTINLQNAGYYNVTKYVPSNYITHLKLSFLYFFTLNFCKHSAFWLEIHKHLLDLHEVIG